MNAHIRSHPFLIATLLVIIIFVSASFAHITLAATTIGTDIVTAGKLTVGGSVGIGTTNPLDLLHIAGDRTIGEGDPSADGVSQLFIGGVTEPNKRLSIGYDTTTNFAVLQSAITGSYTTPLILNPQGGFVGIGTTTPGKELDVNGNVNIGNASGEYAGIIVNGDLEPSSLMVSDLSDNDPLMIITHRHSTTVAPIWMSARSNADDTHHASVTAGESLLDILGVGVTNNSHSSYNKFAQISYLVNAQGTVSNTSSPGDLQFLTTTNGLVTPSEKMRILANGSVGIGTSTPFSMFQVTNGASATTTVTFGEVGDTTSHACFNTKNTTGADVSFYFVGTAMVVEPTLCR